MATLVVLLSFSKDKTKKITFYEELLRFMKRVDICRL